MNDRTAFLLRIIRLTPISLSFPLSSPRVGLSDVDDGRVELLPLVPRVHHDQHRQGQRTQSHQHRTEPRQQRRGRRTRRRSRGRGRPRSRGAIPEVGGVVGGGGGHRGGRGQRRGRHTLEVTGSRKIDFFCLPSSFFVHLTSVTILQQSLSTG
jgi:hypothetical protein